MASALALGAGTEAAADDTRRDITAVMTRIADQALKNHDDAYRKQVQSRLLSRSDAGAVGGVASYSAFELGEDGVLDGDARLHSADLMRWLRRWRSNVEAKKIKEATEAGAGPLPKPRLPVAARRDAILPIWTAGGISAIAGSSAAVAYRAEPIHGMVGAGHRVGKTAFGVVGGVERAAAHIVQGNTDLRSDMGSIAGYFGRRHRDLLVDGSLGWAHVDNSVGNATAAGEFDAERVFATFNLTGVHETAWSRSLPRIGVRWQHESQESYVDADGDLQPGHESSPARLVFGDEVYLVPPDAPEVQPFIRAEGEWNLELSDPAGSTDGSAFAEDDFGMILGGGVKADFGPGSSLLIEATTDAVGSEETDTFSLKAEASIAY